MRDTASSSRCRAARAAADGCWVRLIGLRGINLAERRRSGSAVAEWAGHSVGVLLLVYATCITGQDEDAKRRIEAATMPQEGDRQ